MLNASQKDIKLSNEIHQSKVSSYDHGRSNISGPVGFLVRGTDL